MKIENKHIMILAIVVLSIAYLALKYRHSDELKRLQESATQIAHERDSLQRGYNAVFYDSTSLFHERLRGIIADEISKIEPYQLNYDNIRYIHDTLIFVYEGAATDSIVAKYLDGRLQPEQPRPYKGRGHNRGQ